MLQCRALFCGLLASLVSGSTFAQNGPLQVKSPDAQITFVLSDGDELRYSINFHGKALMTDSRLGLEIVGQSPLGPGMRKVSTHLENVDERYSIPFGKTRTVRNHYNAIREDLQDNAGRKITIEVRVFDDGAAFRYVLPEQPLLKQVQIAHELTQFSYAKDPTTYPLILDGFQSSYEDEYQERLVSGLHSDWLIGLPLLAEEPAIGWVAITEANIDKYAGMYLRKDIDRLALRAELAPHLDDSGVAVNGATPLTSPWRVFMIGDEPGRLIESNIIMNLNPASKIADTSWIRPGKSAWDWWSGEAAPSVPFKTGMNTATMKHYIDFAEASGFPYMLVDGGWAESPSRRPDGTKLDGSRPDDYAQLDITRANPDIDMPELLRYAKAKNVRIWVWSHWTSVEKYMDQAFPLFEQWGIAGVKIDFMNRDDQWMVDFYHRVAETAAAHHLMIDFHGAYKPDGLRRTYPNLITREGVMGKEYSKWSGRVTPTHDTTLPFTRMLAGPMDYTPGAFGNSSREAFIARNFMPMSLGTRAHELALYVVFESPFAMVSDYPERYQGQKDFDFIKNVPTNWDEVRVISGRPMQSITIARRNGKDWYVGSLTNWDKRDVSIPLSFLDEGDYFAEMYADAPDAGKEATKTIFSKTVVNKQDVLKVHMVSGGGNAIWLHRAGGEVGHAP